LYQCNWIAEYLKMGKTFLASKLLVKPS